MKLIMENWRKFLKEGISDVVYHFTNGMEKGAKILEDNRFLASGGFSKDVESQLGQGKLYYFLMTDEAMPNNPTGHLYTSVPMLVHLI